MIVYNCYLHELFILQSYIFSVRKKKKKQEFAFFTVFLPKSYKRKGLCYKKTQKDDLAKRKVILFITGILHP